MPATTRIDASAAAPAMLVHCQRPSERHQATTGEAVGGALALRICAVSCWGTGGLSLAAACKRRSRTRSAASVFCRTSAAARSASSAASRPATQSSSSRSWSADSRVASRPRFDRTASITWSTASGSSLPSGGRAFMV